MDSFIQFINILEAPFTISFTFILLLLIFSSFLKVSLIFGFLRIGLGLGSFAGFFFTLGISLALTYFIMSPTIEHTFSNLEVDCAVEKDKCIKSISDKWKDYLIQETPKAEKETFKKLVRQQRTSKGLETSNQDLESWQMIAPAFVISEIKKAFSIGLKILLPFLVIDLVCAYLFAALNIQALNVVTLTFPLKVLAFTALDGWTLLVENLLMSYIGN